MSCVVELLCSVSTSRSGWRSWWDRWYQGFTNQSQDLADSTVLEEYERACETHGPDSPEAKSSRPRRRTSGRAENRLRLDGLTHRFSRRPLHVLEHSYVCSAKKSFLTVENYRGIDDGAFPAVKLAVDVHVETAPAI